MSKDKSPKSVKQSSVPPKSKSSKSSDGPKTLSAIPPTSIRPKDPKPKK